MVLPTIVRKQLGETRWSLFFTFAGFFAFTLLYNWFISQYQNPPTDDDPQPTASSKADSQADRVEEGKNQELDNLQSEANSDGQTAAAQEGEPSASPSPEQENRDSDEEPRRRRRRGGPPAQIYIGLGVPPDRMMDPADPPTLLMQTTLFNHPLVWMALMGWAIARGAASVAGEIERGTLDQTLSRPVYRSTYLTAQIVTTTVTLGVMALALVAGHLTAPWLYKLHQPPGPLAYLPPVVMMLALGLAIYGYTLVFSSVDLVRARVGIIGLALTIGGLAAIVSTRQYPDWQWLEQLSAFHYYAPVGITADWNQEQWQRLGKLFGVFGVGTALSYFFFLRRDLPTSAG